jgi:hypothetical protein
MLDPAAPRWPHVRPGRGHYESFYLRAVDPDGSRGVWIRYTVTLPPGGEPAGQLWCTVFDRAAAGPRAVRVDAGRPDTGGGPWIRLAESTFGEDGIRGAAGGARWDLRVRSTEPPLQHLPRPWLYTAPLPKTKLLSLSPAATFDGTVEFDGETIALEGWPGMVGHNWGAEHAARWIWLHGLGFDGHGSDTWLDVAIGRVRVGPLTTPWVANGALSLDGRRLTVGGLGRRATVAERLDGCELQLPITGGTLTATVAAPASAFVEWDYAQPAGGESRVVNCSVADLTLHVLRPGEETVELTAPGRAAYELGRES